MSAIAILDGKAKSTAEIIKQILLQIEILNRNTISVEKIIDVINDIANQTNLLSLNASIEAARAGNQGRGFGVVAQEIGNLARQSMESSKMITSLVGDIQKCAKDMCHITSQTENVIQEQKVAMNDTVGSFQNISKHVDNMLKNVDGVVNNIKIMENAKEITLHSIQNMTDVSKETVVSAEMVSSVLKKQFLEINTLELLSKELDQYAVALETEIIRFKIDEDV